ncbi:MFS transporter [Bacillus velezensis]|uniref:MFS transporter n=1 Tax=Bacillus velezensis TaxID=492670 RepID=UPI0021075E36|nr:MFS transporter [Bacillus velezensis]UTY66886.1 MFS transporter [Bacillus velezensis]
MTNSGFLQKSKSSTGLSVLIVLALGFLMATLDVTVVNVAMADMKNTLSMSLSGVTWVVDGYILTFASLLLAGGALADRFGSKAIYILGLAVFVLASCLCAVSINGQMLIAGRLMQGIGAALFMPSSLSLLAASYPDERVRARIFGLWAALVSAASGLGPFIGGVLVQTAGWQSIFLINVPLGAAALISAYRILGRVPGKSSRVNLTGHLLGVAALGFLSFALIQGPSAGWLSPIILGAFAAALLAFVLFLLREISAETSILPASLYKNGRFSAAQIVGFLLNFALFGGMFMLSLFLQEVRGASSFIAGVELLPMMAVFVIGNMLFSRLANWFEAGQLMFMSMAASCIIALLLFVLVSPDFPYWQLAVLMSVMNLGTGITVPAMTTMIMQAAGQQHANIAGAALNANRQIGALVGVAVSGVIIHLSATWYAGAGFTFLMMGAAYSLAALLVWLFLAAHNGNAATEKNANH